MFEHWWVILSRDRQIWHMLAKPGIKMYCNMWHNKLLQTYSIGLKYYAFYTIYGKLNLLKLLSLAVSTVITIEQQLRPSAMFLKIFTKNWAKLTLKVQYNVLLEDYFFLNKL